jgi:hypothetical protein
MNRVSKNIRRSNPHIRHYKAKARVDDVLWKAKRSSVEKVILMPFIIEWQEAMR